MFGWFKKRDPTPELVEFRGEREHDRLHEITLRVDRSQCLTKRELWDLRAYGVGVTHWWLRNNSLGFAVIDLPRGDRPFCRRLLIPPGWYVLGVGSGVNGLRIRFNVASDGSLSGPGSSCMEAHAQ